MKKLLFLFVLINTISYSQNIRNNDETEALRKLKDLMESDATSELEAQKTVFNFYLDTKKELRKSYSELSDLEKTELDNQQKKLWSVVQEIIDNYKDYKGYKGFLREQYQMLTEYNEAVYDLLYYLIDNDISDKKKHDEFNLICTKKYFSFQINTPK